MASSPTALVAVGENGTILYSDYADVRWHTRVSGTDAWLLGVAHGRGRWIAVGDSGIVLVSDDDGVTWEPRPSGVTTRLNAIAHADGVWLAVGEGGVVLRSDSAGNTWTVTQLAETGFLRGLAADAGRFVFGGARGVLYQTTDGRSLQRIPVDTTADIEAVDLAGDRVFIVGSNGLRAVAERDGPWNITAAPDVGTLRGLVARGDSSATAGGDRVLFHFDGLAWRQELFPPRFLITAMARGRGEAVAVGFGGGIARSSSFSELHIVESHARGIFYGDELRLRAVADTGGDAVRYQWRHNGADIPGATAAELVVSNIKPAQSGVYSVHAETDFTNRSAGRNVEVLPRDTASAIDVNFRFPFEMPPSTLLFLPGGKLLVRGPYTGARGSTSSRWVRLNPDGSIDDSFRIEPPYSSASLHPLPDGRLYTAALQGGSAGSPPLPVVVRLLPNGGIDPSFTLGLPLARSSPLHALPDGRVYIDANGTILRLLPDGRVDASFVSPPSGYFLRGVDAAGWLYLSRSDPSDTHLTDRLHRFDASGARDSNFAIESTYNAYVQREFHAFAGGYVFGVNRSLGRLGWGTSYFRSNGSARPSAGYTPPPPGPYPETGIFTHIFRPDGGLWDFRLDTMGAGWSVRSYDPEGRIEVERTLHLPDRAFYRPLAVAPDGGIYAARTTADGNGQEVVRLRPSVGLEGRLANLSVRSVASPDEPLIAGFVVEGSAGLPVLARGIGPALDEFGVSDAMRDPALSLFAGTALRTANANWAVELASVFHAAGAFPLPAGSRDAAAASTIGGGAHSVVVAPEPGAAGGVVLAELYALNSDATDPAAPRFANLSARGVVSATQPLIAGFTLGGTQPRRVLLRGVGPELRTFGVGSTLADPKLTLYRGEKVLYENDHWSEANPTLANTSTAKTGAFPLPVGSSDAGLAVTLSPGSYTAVVESADGRTGTALVEIYEAPTL